MKTNAKQRPLKQMPQIISHSVARVLILSSCIKKNALLVGSEKSILSISVISQVLTKVTASNPCGLYLRNIDGSSSVWEYLLPIKLFRNFYNYCI